MPADTKKQKPAKGRTKPAPEIAAQVREAMAALQEMSTPHDFDNLARFGITASKALGVSVANIRLLAKRLGRNHDLAAALWDTGCYEARLLTSFVDDPALVTPAQMDRWCRDFDNWGIVDTLCFHLFDKTPHAWKKVTQWSTRLPEFEKRAAFALLASLALHDKKTGDEPFLASLPLIERAASDERNFVKKGVSWALRLIGRRNAALHEASVMLARRLSAAPESAARWIGRDAVKELTSPAVLGRLRQRALKAASK
jgi:3-methyladenine DNA glycosylase AlkD